MVLLSFSKQGGAMKKALFCLIALVFVVQGCRPGFHKKVDVEVKEYAVKEAKAEHQIPIIGETAPSFTAETTQGKINFPEDYKGSWVVLFSHPADFTPVCTTEFMTFASMQKDWDALNTKLIGLSIDSNYSHIAWLRTIKEKIQYKGMKDVEVTFPVIADLTMEVAKKYGMIQPSASNTQAVRAVFFIDPESKIRALIYYPLSNGRNFKEIKRLLIAMQTSDKYKVATPADWQPGDDVIVPPPGSCGSAKERVASAAEKGYNCLDWFLCLKPLQLQ
jgi:peroxiredoxin (alkyl hydroperoxide reductase subunit C)